MVTHSSTLAWEIPWTEEPGELADGVAKESDKTWQLNTIYLFKHNHSRSGPSISSALSSSLSTHDAMLQT